MYYYLVQFCCALVFIQYDHLNNLKSQFDENSRLQDDMLKSFDSQVLQDNLKVAALEAEEKSESIAEEFLEGSSDLFYAGFKYCLQIIVLK